MKNSQLVARFIDVSRLEKNLSPRTLRAYRCDLDDMLEFLGKRSLCEAGIEELREYLAHLEGRNLKDTTVKRRLATLKVFFAFLEEEGIIDLSPARKLKKKFRTARRLPRVMQIDDVRKMLSAAYKNVAAAGSSTTFHRYKAIRDRAMLELLFATGIRIDELARLNKGDLILPARQITVFGKGRKERQLYLSSDEVVGALRDYLRERNAIAVETKALFLNRGEQRLGTNAVRSVFQRYARLAHVDSRFTPHCFRHTMATLLIENGADVRSVQEILGHSRISTTEIYLTVSQIRKREVLRRFNGRNTFSLCP